MSSFSYFWFFPSTAVSFFLFQMAVESLKENAHFCFSRSKVHPSAMTVDAGRRLLFLGVILWLGHQDCRALLPTAPTDQHVQIGKFCQNNYQNFNSNLITIIF
jgi:hypothetical protein